MDRHAGKKPHQCSDCGRAFVSKASLERHIRALHCLESPYKCDECGKCFKVKENLQKHSKVHQEPKHQCKVRKNTLRLFNK